MTAAGASLSQDSLQAFLKDIGKVDLLTAAQEVELAKRIERGDHGAKQEMVEANLRLVVSIAKRYRNQGRAVPRPDPGRVDRPHARRGEVRPPQGLQVLDLRDVVDPAGRRACARRQGADDPDADARRREAEQDRALGTQAPRRAVPRAESRPRSRATQTFRSTRWSRSSAARRRRCRSRSRSATRETSEFGHFLADSAPLPEDVADDNSRSHALTESLATLTLRERTRARASLRARRKGAGDVGRNRRDLQRDAGAHPADREELHGEAERPHRNEEPPRRCLRADASRSAVA